jgi:hypothetical protein
MGCAASAPPSATARMTRAAACATRGAGWEKRENRGRPSAAVSCTWALAVVEWHVGGMDLCSGFKWHTSPQQTPQECVKHTTAAGRAPILRLLGRKQNAIHLQHGVKSALVCGVAAWLAHHRSKRLCNRHRQQGGAAGLAQHPHQRRAPADDRQQAAAGAADLRRGRGCTAEQSMAMSRQGTQRSKACMASIARSKARSTTCLLCEMKQISLAACAAALSSSRGSLPGSLLTAAAAASPAAAPAAAAAQGPAPLRAAWGAKKRSSRRAASAATWSWPDRRAAKMRPEPPAAPIICAKRGHVGSQVDRNESSETLQGSARNGH